jgi:purine-binding chemotaxis protein CheW
MGQSTQVVMFEVSGRAFAFPLPVVQRVIATVAFTPLPDNSPGICVAGETIPVVDLRHRFNLPARDVELTDQIILVQTGTRRLAVLADAVTGVGELGPHQTLLDAEAVS